MKEGAKIAKKIGYPVIIKAALGGGGKGMRVAQNPEEFEQSFRQHGKKPGSLLEMKRCILNIL